MCQELEDELKRGQEAATALAEHIEETGAANISIPVETDDGCYIITIRKTL